VEIINSNLVTFLFHIKKKKKKKGPKTKTKQDRIQTGQRVAEVLSKTLRFGESIKIPYSTQWCRWRLHSPLFTILLLLPRTVTMLSFPPLFSVHPLPLVVSLQSPTTFLLLLQHPGVSRSSPWLHPSPVANPRKVSPFYLFSIWV